MTPPESRAAILAAQAVAILKPLCHRVEIAGSIRRGKAEPKDIEIVCIPIMSRYEHRNLLGEVYAEGWYSGADAALETFSDAGWRLDPELKRNGPLYKRLTNEAGIPLDLFITDPASWGVIYTLRTGPADFSQALVTRARQLKMQVTERRLHNHPIYKIMGGERKCSAGAACDRLIETPEESDFFAGLKLNYIEPAARSLKALGAAGIGWRK